MLIIYQVTFTSYVSVSICVMYCVWYHIYFYACNCLLPKNLLSSGVYNWVKDYNKTEFQCKYWINMTEFYSFRKHINLGDGQPFWMFYIPKEAMLSTNNRGKLHCQLNNNLTHKMCSIFALGTTAKKDDCACGSLGIISLFISNGRILLSFPKDKNA